jgi:tellurite resistance protein TerC
MIIFWIAFLILVAGMLALDLGVFNKKDHEIGVGEALRWTGVWIGVSLLFNLALYFLYGKGYIPNTELSGGEAALEFLTGYIIEKSLSMDNIFVMAAIFGYFKIPKIYQHRVLFWGILGAIIFRGVFVIGGAALLHHFEWIMYVFGALLIFSALKMLFSKEDEEQDLSQNTVVKLAKKFFPITTKIEGHAFFLKENGKRFITPLLLSLLVIETTDIFFAVDSIPAIFAVTQDPFIVFTSNIMAILGLRSLYFALAAMLGKFHLLKYALVFILGFVGVKMLIMEVYKIPTWISLSVIVFALGLGIAASFMFPAKEEK